MGIFEKLQRTLPLSEGRTLYYPGCYAQSKAKHVIAATKEALRDMGVDYVMLDLPSCGCVAWLAGYEDDFLAIKKQVAAQLKQYHITKIITNDPECALTFKERYGVDAHHVVEVFDRHIEMVKKQESHQVNYLHSGFLDRLGVEQRVPIRVLRRADYHVPAENRSHGRCTGLDFARNDPETAAAIVHAKLSQPLSITCCPHCSVAYAQQGVKIKDIAEVLEEH